jgi:hypothetical protein
MPCSLGLLFPSSFIFKFRQIWILGFGNFVSIVYSNWFSQTQTSSTCLHNLRDHVWYSALRNCTPLCNSQTSVLCTLNIMWLHSCTPPSHHHNTANRITYVLHCHINQTTVYTDIQK